MTGLVAEAKLLRDGGFLVAVGGGEPAGALLAAQRLIGEGAAMLVSFGLCGGLLPGLKPGAVLVPYAVVEGAVTYKCNMALLAYLGGGTGGKILAAPRMTVSVADKAGLYRHYGAAAVDLESGAVARAASAQGLPFAVLRAVADPAGRALPPAAVTALDEDGNIRLPRVVLSLLRHPAQLPGLMALGKDAALARAALVARVRQLG